MFQPSVPARAPAAWIHLPSQPLMRSDSDLQWLKDHRNVRCYVDGHASWRGELICNLALSQRDADWVKQTLVSRGISGSRILVAAGWGHLYPLCPTLNDQCWTKNRLVPFVHFTSSVAGSVQVSSSRTRAFL